MVTGDRIEVNISGGTPWGFRLQGGGPFPLEVAKIRKKSRADDADLREGDIVTSINGSPTSGKSHGNAMDIVEQAGNQITMEVIRPASGPPANRPQDPQRIQRTAAMAEGPPANRPLDPPKIQRNVTTVQSTDILGGSGIVTKSQSSYSTTEGNTRHDVHQQEVVVHSTDGSRVTKKVTESRVTSVGESSGLPALPQSVLKGERESRPLNKTHNVPMWKPKSLSPVPNQSNIQSGIHSENKSEKHVETKETLVWKPPTKTAVPAQDELPYRSHTLPKPKKRTSLVDTKENVDPVLASEQAKWEARQGPADVPVFRLDNFGSRRAVAAPRDVKPFIPPPKDPKYPMFEPPKTDWIPPAKPLETKRLPPPVAPKPLTPIPSDSHPDGSYQNEHLPGMIAPPPQESDKYKPSQHYPGMSIPPIDPSQGLKPAPPPPPMPSPLDGPQGGQIPSMPKKFRPGHSSTPIAKHYHDDTDGGHHDHPDHLPVFGPQVSITPQEYTGLPDFPEHDLGPITPSFFMDDGSDIGHKKLFSDSAFYDEPLSRYPTITQQMSMCKEIAHSLTSAANRRAKGARMFLKRKRKSTKWIHEGQFFGYSSEYSSSGGGDVGVIGDLDSELYGDEGGCKPLFSFRIPKIAGQSTEGQKMSLSKDEFERLRLGSTKCEHQGVSPAMCFNIAADLHKGGKNRGAKLFQKRQQRVEKFVIDESNIVRPPQQTKLDHILQSPPSKPQPSPWEAAAQGDMSSAFTKLDNRAMMHQNLRPLGPGPSHKLENDGQLQLLEGVDFNRKARGWGGHPDAPHNYQTSHTETTETSITFSQSDVIADDVSSVQSHGSSNYHQDQMTSSQTSDPGFPRGATSPTQADDNYNRRAKGWGDNSQTVSTKRSMHTYNEQYFSVPRGERGQCDL